LSSQPKAQTVTELTQKLSELIEQKSKINAEAAEWAEKRDNLNEHLRNLRNEITQLKSQRDILNTKVQELKRQREEAKEKIHENIEEIYRLRNEIEAYNKKKPRKNRQILEKELESIEWKIQTTPLSPQEDKEHVEKVKQLETQLGTYKKLEQLNNKIRELQTEIKTLKTNSTAWHQKLTENAQESQETHKKMLEKIEESKKLKKEADNFHALFVQTREKIRPIQNGFLQTSNQMKQLKDEIRETEEKEKKKDEGILKDKLEKQAREKLKRGEKLSWEEFQILAEKGIEA
jgi:chromosome segregation protein